MLSVPEPVKWVVWRTTLHSKSALRKSELLWALHWFANGRKGDSGSAGPAPPAAVGASEDDTERMI